RGHLALRTDRLVVEADIEPVKGRPGRSDALSGKAGLEVATTMLMQPGRQRAVRELARALGRSPSTVSEVLAGLRGEGLTDERNTVVGTELFWRVAERWETKRTRLATTPSLDDMTLSQPLRLGLDHVVDGAGWALTDSAAAAAYGAPLPFRNGQVLDFFVPDQGILRRATTLLGSAAPASQPRATVRVAPVPATVGQRVDLDRNPTGWPLAHPLFVALDLAQDAGRGREILEAWTPDDRWTRVW
ncbi:MAG: transcriptional regulator, partial [Angustibacter sp.]